MPGLVYFDTDVFHRIGDTFHKHALNAELRDRLVLSPITFIEVLSQLTLNKSGGGVLGHIQAMHNWVNPNHAQVLPWPTIAIAKAGFNKEVPDDGFTERVQEAVNICLNAPSVEDVREPAAKLKDELDRVKQEAAQSFERLVAIYRKEPLVGEKFSEVWIHGIAHRVKVDPKSRPAKEIVAALGAYHEYESAKIKVAAENRGYDPVQHQNDLLDSEQLVYLADPPLHFLTCDGGYERRVRSSEQARRIHKTSLDKLAQPAQVELLIRKITN